MKKVVKDEFVFLIKLFEGNLEDTEIWSVLIILRPSRRSGAATQCLSANATVVGLIPT